MTVAEIIRLIYSNLDNYYNNLICTDHHDQQFSVILNDYYKLNIGCIYYQECESIDMFLWVNDIYNTTIFDFNNFSGYDRYRTLTFGSYEECYKIPRTKEDWFHQSLEVKFHGIPFDDIVLIIPIFNKLKDKFRIPINVL